VDLKNNPAELKARSRSTNHCETISTNIDRNFGASGNFRRRTINTKCRALFFGTDTHISLWNNGYVPEARYFLISRNRWHARSRYFFGIVGASRDTCRRALANAP